MLRPKKCVSCGKMQQAGYKIDISSAAAPPITEADFLPENYASPKIKKIKDTNNSIIGQAISNGIIDDYNNLYAASQEKKINPNRKFSPLSLLNGATLGTEWLSGLTERNRQDTWDINKMSQLGQMNPIPASDYQPNPFSLYAKFGGEFMKGGGKNWLKGAVNPDHKGWCTPLSNPHCTGHRRAFALMMKHKHGFHEDGGIIEKSGGLTSNDARQILHDGEVKDHKLTDKQRRFFGAMSKGHTNFKGK